jgi:geranylgeranyl pyrophosphate synthase
MNLPQRNHPEVLSAHSEELSAICRANVIAGLSEAPCSDVLISHFNNAKMLRAGLVFTATAAVNGQPGEVTFAAESLELLHGASLIHDDIIDGARERRGLPAVHLRVSPGTGLVLADYLIFRSFARLSQAESLHPAKNVLKALRVLTHHAEECCRGQVEELDPACYGYGEEDYLSLIQRKTGSLFAAAAQLGPILVGASEEDVLALTSYGLAVGTAFQIRDDMLDLVGEVHSLGKPIGNSLSNRRPSLPIIYLHKYGSKFARAKFLEMRRLQRPPKEVARLLAEEGMFARAQCTQQRQIGKAAKALEQLRPSAAHATLATFTQTVAALGFDKLG